jgi:nucleotide-binding universal stress UspA family protein
VGDPVYEIIGYAQKQRADAIVMGTHGRSGLKRLFMGSVAEGVLRCSPVPVLTVREEAKLAHVR